MNEHLFPPFVLSLPLSPIFQGLPLTGAILHWIIVKKRCGESEFFKAKILSFHRMFCVKVVDNFFSQFLKLHNNAREFIAGKDFEVNFVFLSRYQQCDKMQLASSKPSHSLLLCNASMLCYNCTQLDSSSNNYVYITRQSQQQLWFKDCFYVPQALFFSENFCQLEKYKYILIMNILNQTFILKIKIWRN